MLLCIEALMSLMGIIFLVTGRYPRSGRGTIVVRGWRARVIGILYLFTVPLVFGAGYALGWFLVYVLHRDYNREQILPAAVIVEIIVVISVGIIASMIAYSTPDDELTGRDHHKKNKTLKQAAMLLQVPESEVMRMIEDGELVAKRFGGQYYIANSVLNVFMAGPPIETQPDDPDPMIRALTELVQKNPNDAETLFTRGKRYHQLGNTARAASDFKRVVALNPTHPQASRMQEYVARYWKAVGSDGELLVDSPPRKQKAKRGVPRRFQPSGAAIALAVTLLIISAVVVSFISSVNDLQAGKSRDSATISGTRTPTMTPDPLQAPDGATDPYFRLKYNVHDAAYSQSLDRLIMTSTDPSELHVYDPQTHTDQAVPLLGFPLSLALSIDGKFAVVGHDRLVTYIDLGNASAVKTYQVPFKVGTLALAANGWLYLMPNEDQANALAALEIATGRITDKLTSTDAGGYRTGSMMMSSDGKTLYIASPTDNPDAIARAELLESGLPQFTSNKRYQGLYQCAKLALTPDNQRIFNNCGTITRLSSDPKLDMRPNGQLDRVVAFSYVTFVPAINQFIALHNLSDQERRYSQSTNGQTVELFNYEALNRVRSLDLPRFISGGRYSIANGRYVFANKSGTRYYVIAQADPAAGLLHDFAIWSTDLK